MSIFKQPQEPFSAYLYRVRYGFLRRLVPPMREKHFLGEMVGPARYWDRIQEYQFNVLTKIGLKPHHRLLDMGCGPLSGGLVFIPYLKSGNYFGVDLRKECIQEAYNQLAKAGLADKNPTLIVSSTFGQEELDGHKFDYIWISQLLYHLDDQKTEHFFEEASGRMNPGSKLYGDILGRPNNLKPDSSWQGFLFYERSPDYYLELAKRYNLNMRVRGTLEDYGYPPEIGGLKRNYLLEFVKKA